MNRIVLKVVVASVVIMALAGFDVKALPVDTNTAKVVAKNFLQKHDPSVKTTGTFRISIAARANGLSNLYIVERTDKAGFVVISADDRVQPVLAYSTTSSVANEIPVNALDWFRGYDGEIGYCVSNNLRATEEVRTQWNQLIGNQVQTPQSSSGNGVLNAPVATQSNNNVVVGPLLTTTWDQAPLYNIYCPYDNTYQERTVVGCVATAMAQIMKYWNYPTTGIGSNSYSYGNYGTISANFGNTTYDWANMPNALYQSSTSAQIQAVATLSYHCGVAVNMEYGVSSQGGSSAYTNGDYYTTSEYALKTFFGYKSTLGSAYRSNYGDAQWDSILRRELIANRPILYRGSGTGGGHAFVCDGYDYFGLFHFNWGWGGMYNGFFASNNLAPGGGGIGSNQSNTFNTYQAVIIGIEPNNGSLVVRPQSMTFSSVGGSQTLSIRPALSDANRWHATTVYPWISLSANSGAGSGTVANITVTVQPNTTGYNRRGEIVVVQHNDTVRVSLLQSYGTNSLSGKYGNSDVDYYAPADSGLFIGIRPEKFGNFKPGDTIKSIYYRTYDNTANHSAYMDSNFVIRIYENCTPTSNFTRGTSDVLSNVLGTLVYTQNYHQPYPGHQEVTLTTPYVINSNTFWIILSSAGRTQFMYKVDYKDSVLRSSYPNPSLVEGRYFIGNWRSSMIRSSIYNEAAVNSNYLYQSDCLWAFGFNVSTGSPTVIAARPDTASHGYVLGGGAYTVGDTVTLQAFALPGYSFVRWSDSVATPSRTFVIQPDTYYPEYVAVYTAATSYTLSVVSSNPQLGTTFGSGRYFAGDTVSAIAIPADSTRYFVRWHDNNTSNPRRFAINANTQLVATFATRATGGTTVHDTIHDTTYINITVRDTIHDTSFVNVPVHDTTYINITVRDTIHDTSFVNVPVHDTTYINITVHDTIHDTSFVNVPVHDTTYINITVHDTTYVNVPVPVHDTTYINITVHDTAYINVPVHDTTYINVAVHDTIRDTAYVNLPQHNFNITSANNAQGVTVGSGTYPQGLRVGIAAVPAEGYRFSHWSDNNTDNPRHFTVSGDVTLTAHFTVGSQGVPTPDKSVAIEIYPNPTTGFITLSQFAEKVEVLDTWGRLVAVAENVINMDLSDLAEGTYTLRISTQGAVVLKKVVKR